MNKNMSSKEQDRRQTSAKIDEWFKRNFGDIAEDDPIQPKLQAARTDVYRLFGLDVLQKGVRP